MPRQTKRPPKKTTKKKDDEEEKKEETNGHQNGHGTQSAADLLSEAGIIATFAAASKTQHRNAKDINVANLTVAYHGNIIIDDSDLILSYGNRYGFIGRNGSGKSTLMKVIAARAVPIPDGIDLFYLKEEIEPTDKTALEAVMEVDSERALLEREAEQINDQLGECEDEELLDRLNYVYERLEEMDAATAETRASSILRGLGFTTKTLAKKTRDFSGGWRMRIALARALFIQPTLLLLDEPTSHLDLEAVIWLEEYLKHWKRLLFMVCHSQDFMNNVCSHIVHLGKKQLTYYGGNYDQYIQTREEVEENQMKRYQWEQDQIKGMKEYIARFGHGSAKLAKQAQSKEKTLAKMTRGGLVERVEKERVLNFKFPDPGKLPPPVLQFQQITFGYEGQPSLYENVDFGLDLDSRVTLVGPNGAGKSTLLKLINGQLIPRCGNVRPHSHLRISTFTQHFVDVLDLEVTPLDYMCTQYPDQQRDDMRKFLGRYGCSGDVQTQVMGQLSEGQKARVVFAKIAKDTPHMLLLDEPTNALDMESIDALVQAVNEFQGGVVIVSHDMRLISQVSKEIWIVDNHTVAKFPGDIKDFKMMTKRRFESGQVQVKT